MKTRIDIITGFLGSGKTSFINEYIKSDLFSKENIVIIQCEAGEEDYVLYPEVQNISIVTAERNNTIDALFLRSIIKDNKPDRIIIENNGMWSTKELFDVLEDNNLRKACVVDKVFYITDSSTFNVYMNNMGSILVEQIVNCDSIIINNMGNVRDDILKGIIKTLKGLNKSGCIMTIESKDEYKLAFDIKAYSEKEGKLVFKTQDKVFGFILSAILVYFLWDIAKAYYRPEMLSKLYTFNTVFISILAQAFPFIIIGVFISSIIQVLISKEAILRLFPKDKLFAFFAAIALGLIFPVCDCTIVPVAGRLVKKGVPLPIAITFMLSAPIVNPIVIASTFYAFPGQAWVGAYRIFLGITVAVAVGIALMFFSEKDSILKSDIENISCGCDYCSTGYDKSKGIMRKLEAIFMHAASEFFEVGKFLIIGAFSSTLFQTVVSKDALSGLGGKSWLSLLIMMLAAFVLSICSTSDAFIARSFLNQFSISSVIGFLVLGPMIDIKNLLMLSAIFRKRFVIKMVLTVFSLSFIIIYVFTSVLGG